MKLVLLHGEELKAEMLKKARQLYSDASYGMSAGSTVQWNVPLMTEQAKYAVGTQEQIRYKLDPTVQKEAGSNPGLIYTSATRNVQFANKLLTNAIGLMEKQRYEPQANRIDKSSMDHRKEYRKDLEFAVKLNQMQVSYDKMAQELQIDPSTLPERTDELDMFMYSDTALDEEIGMEYALAQTDEYFNMPAIIRQVRMYLAVHGVAGIRIDNSGPKLIIRAIAPMRTRTSYSEKEDLSDISYFREAIFIPLIYLQTYYCDTFTKTEWDTISSLAVPYDEMIGYGGGLNASYGGFEGDLFVQVLDAVWKEGNKYNLKIKATEKGLKTYNDIGGSKGTYKQEPIECVVGLKWVVGTDILFDYGRQIPELRCPVPADPEDLKNHDWRPCLLPVTLYRPMPLYGISVTMLDKVIPVIDELQNLTNKYNNLVKNVKPGITAIDIGQLADLMSNSAIRDAAVVKRIMLNYMQKGDIFWDSTKSADNPGRNAKPVESYADNTAIQLEMLWQQIMNQMNLAREMTGIPQIVDGITADRQGKGTTEISLNMVETGLSYLGVATKDIYERSHKQLCLLYQYTGKSGMHKNKTYEIDPKVAKEWIFNITCRMVATNEDWAELKQAAYQAWANGEGWLSYQDLIYIKDNPNLKEAQKRFGYLDRQNKKEMKAMNDQNQQVNEEMSQASIEAKQAELQFKIEGEVAKQQEIGSQKMEQLAFQAEEKASANRKEMAHEVALAVMQMQAEREMQAKELVDRENQPVAA